MYLAFSQLLFVEIFNRRYFSVLTRLSAGPRASGVLWAAEPGRTCSTCLGMHTESDVVLLWKLRECCYTAGNGRARSLGSGRPAEGIFFFPHY